MGLSKRIWIEQDPAYEAERQAYHDAAVKAYEEKTKLYTFQLACRRFEKVGGKRKLDRIWNIALTKAVRELDADCIQINEGLFFKTKEDLHQTKALAEKLRNDTELLFGKQRARKPVDPNAPQCPECSSEMKKRRARQGYYAGDEFWGCSRYPVCKGLRAIE